MASKLARLTKELTQSYLDLLQFIQHLKKYDAIAFHDGKPYVPDWVVEAAAKRMPTAVLLSVGACPKVIEMDEQGRSTSPPENHDAACQRLRLRAAFGAGVPWPVFS